ncbi:MAG: Histidine ammonia-lyase, partial [Thermotogales bacterium 46_20]
MWRKSSRFQAWRLLDKDVSNLTIIDGRNLRIDDVYRVASLEENVEIDARVEELLAERRTSLIDQISDQVIYGVNTGFGALADKKISQSDIDTLQKNIIMSHSAGVGEPLAEDLVRSIMLVRANSLCTGCSGCRIDVVKQLVDMLNKKITPVVPSAGSVGASGDLAPLSHIALAAIGMGKVIFNGKRMPAIQAMNEAGVEPLVPKAKEGLSLINGTAFMTGIGAFALHVFSKLFEQAILIAAMSTDALLGSTSPFDERLSQARPHPGQAYVARRMREILSNSEIRRSHLDCDRVQDPYTLRAIPQVYGAVHDTYLHALNVIETEMNSATDNPLIFDKDVISGGNFHGEPVAFVLDFMSIALSDMCNMMERRIDRLVNPALNDFSPFLAAGKEGLNSGYMLWQYTAAALASENKTLA